MKMDRRIGFEGIDNCRQLGGLPGAEGKTIKNGLLLRSANLFGATARDGEVLTGTYRLTTVIDLRTDTERERKPDPVFFGRGNHLPPHLRRGHRRHHPGG